MTNTAWELLDSDRYDDPPMGPSEQDYRDMVARTLRGLRHQPKCSVTTDLQREWQRKALELMAFRRADVKVQR